MSRRALLAVSAAAMAIGGGYWIGYGIGTATTSGSAAPRPLRLAPRIEALDRGSTGCGVERAAVKHLTDLTSQSLGAPQPRTIAELVSATPPAVGRDSPRFPVEQTVVRLDSVHVVAVKQEPDSDLHIIVATDAGAEMNVESPMARCDASSPYAAQLAQARVSADAALPTPSASSYTPVDLRATIVGVLFFDVLHGQRGAPSGVELHPLLSFTVGGAPPPPPPPPSGRDDGLDELPGCVKYPDRIYLHHAKQSHCAARFFKTP